MYPGKYRETNATIALVRELAHADKSGIGVPSLSSRLLIPPERIEVLARRHPEYFVQVGHWPRYRLNKFGSFDGSAEQILADIEQSQERSRRLQIASGLMAIVGVLIAVISLL